MIFLLYQMNSSASVYKHKFYKIKTENMRLKLSEILSTIDQFNGTGEYRGQYEGGEQVDINTDLPDEPKQAKVSEGVEQIITDMLNENNTKDTARISPLDIPYSYVMSFDRFINEQKGTPSNVQSYMGELDDEDDEDWE